MSLVDDIHKAQEAGYIWQKGIHVAIGIPNRDDIKSECCGTAEMMAWHLGRQGYNFSVFNIEGAAVDENRNIIFKMAQDKKVDYLFFLDSDTECKEIGNVIGKMIDHKKDVVMGITYLSNYPHRPNIFKTQPNGKVIPWEDEIPEELFKVDSAGNGFQLISKKVLDAFTPAVIEEIGNPFSLIYDGLNIRLREDLAFCWRLRELDLELWADPSIPIVHHKKYPITKMFYETSRKHNESVLKYRV